MRRRTVLALGTASLLSGPARAGGWPDHPVRVVVPYAPGGPVDLVTRLVSEKLGAKFGQSFVVENKPGANGAIGVQSVMASPPDGYTLLLHGSAGVTIYQAVMAQPAFDTLRDLTPISLVVYFDLILCANPALPFKTVPPWVEKLPNGELEVIEGCGHMPMIENPEAVLGRMLTFLRQSTPQAAANS